MMRIFYALLTFAMSALVYANEVGQTVHHEIGDGVFEIGDGIYAIASGMAISFAVLGGAIGQGVAASKALEGIARNPSAADKIFTPLIISLALIESLVIYAFVIAFLLKP